MILFQNLFIYFGFENEKSVNPVHCYNSRPKLTNNLKQHTLAVLNVSDQFNLGCVNKQLNWSNTLLTMPRCVKCKWSDLTTTVHGLSFLYQSIEHKGIYYIIFLDPYPIMIFNSEFKSNSIKSESIKISGVL